MLVPLIRGDHLVCVERSFLNQVKGGATLTLVLACRGKQSIIEFRICDTDGEKEKLERRRLLDIAEAVGIGDDFEDSDQLHGKPFALTVWREHPLRWSCRSLGGVAVGEMASVPNMHPLAHSIILGGDGDGPNVA